MKLRSKLSATTRMMCLRKKSKKTRWEGRANGIGAPYRAGVSARASNCATAFTPSLLSAFACHQLSPAPSRPRSKSIRSFEDPEDAEDVPEPPILDGEEASRSAAAAEEAARAAAAGYEVGDEEEDMTPEEMCAAAEAAAEAARACAASSRIAKRVVELGSGGWGVLCDCAQCVLRTSRAAALKVSKVGHAAMQASSSRRVACNDRPRQPAPSKIIGGVHVFFLRHSKSPPIPFQATLDSAHSRQPAVMYTQAPSWTSEALDAATGRQLGRRAEREMRSLMEDMVTTVRQGRQAFLGLQLCGSRALR